VVIDGGTVSGFKILLYSERSRVRAMKLKSPCAFGAAISGHNPVDTSVVTASHGDGIGIGPASGIVIVVNDISGNFRIGIEISNSANNNLVARTSSTTTVLPRASRVA